MSTEPVSLDIVPTVEIEPSDLGITDYGALLDAGTWPMVQAEALARLGLRALRPGSWQVPVTEIVEAAALDLVLAERLVWTPGEPDTLPPDDEVGPISGGYALVRNGVVALEPGCCCDLGDLIDWQDAVRSAPSTPEPLSIGHGGLSVSREGSSVIVCNTSEPEPAEILRAPAADFTAALERAEQARSALTDRVTAHLQRLGAGARAEAITKILAQGHRSPVVLGTLARSQSS